MNSLYKKNILKISNLNKKEFFNIIKLSKNLKKNKKQKKEIQYLKNKKIALIFEQESTRTRCSFEISAIEQGAYTSFLGPNSIHLGYKESIIDTIYVLDRMYNGIVYRGLDNHLNKISQYSSIPIWNGLTEKHHPTQLLADILTIIEYLPKKKISDIILVYIGDASNNIANSLIETALIIGFEIRFISPKKYWPNKNKINQYELQYNKKNTCTEDIQKGIYQADFVYTDVWISLGNSKNIWNEKINIFKKYQVNDKILKLTNNNNVKVLHCLPALHDQNTDMGKKFSELYNLNNGIEITDSVFQKNKNIIFTQSENRLHTIKALMILTLIKNINFFK